VPGRRARTAGGGFVPGPALDGRMLIGKEDTGFSRKGDKGRCDFESGMMGVKRKGLKRIGGNIGIITPDNDYYGSRKKSDRLDHQAARPQTMSLLRRG